MNTSWAGDGGVGNHGNGWEGGENRGNLDQLSGLRYGSVMTNECTHSAMSVVIMKQCIYEYRITCSSHSYESNINIFAVGTGAWLADNQSRDLNNEFWLVTHPLIRHRLYLSTRDFLHFFEPHELLWAATIEPASTKHRNKARKHDLILLCWVCCFSSEYSPLQKKKLGRISIYAVILILLMV